MYQALFPPPPHKSLGTRLRNGMSGAGGKLDNHWGYDLAVCASGCKEALKREEQGARQLG